MSTRSVHQRIGLQLAEVVPRAYICSEYHSQVQHHAQASDLTPRTGRVLSTGQDEHSVDLITYHWVLVYLYELLITRFPCPSGHCGRPQRLCYPRRHTDSTSTKAVTVTRTSAAQLPHSQCYVYALAHPVYASVFPILRSPTAVRTSGSREGTPYCLHMPQPGVHAAPRLLAYRARDREELLKACSGLAGV